MTRSCVPLILIALAFAAIPPCRLRAQTIADRPAVAPVPLADEQQPPTTPPPTPPPQPAAAAQPPAPPKHEIHGSLTAGLKFLGGVTKAWGGLIDGNVKRPYSATGALVGRLRYDYAKVTIQEDPKVELVQTNRISTAVGVDQTFGKRGIFIARSLYLRDPVQQVFFRFEQLAGVGVHLVNEAKRLDFTFVPGMSLLKEDTFLKTPEGWQAGAGFYERLAAKISKTYSFDESFTYRHDFRADDYSIESITALTGMLTKIVGLQLNYQYVRENLSPPGVKPYQQTLEVGFQLKF